MTIRARVVRLIAVALHCSALTASAAPAVVVHERVSAEASIQGRLLSRRGDASLSHVSAAGIHGLLQVVYDRGSDVAWWSVTAFGPSFRLPVEVFRSDLERIVFLRRPHALVAFNVVGATLFVRSAGLRASSLADAEAKLRNGVLAAELSSAMHREPWVRIRFRNVFDREFLTSPYANDRFILDSVGYLFGSYKVNIRNRDRVSRLLTLSDDLVPIDPKPRPRR